MRLSRIRLFIIISTVSNQADINLWHCQWIIPSYEYIVVENHKGAFEETIRKMNEHGISLVGAVHDYTEPTTGKDYLYFPIREV